MSKTLNDPIYGFISIADELILKIIDQPVMQRLRRIRQMGLAHLVYPGANHTRLSHAIGAMHLAMRGLQILKEKGVSFSNEERLALLSAILLHDIGHGPYSHALEGALTGRIPHEQLSIEIIEEFIDLPPEIKSMVIQILKGIYEKPWINQMVASQLDMDRLDYLGRDSFFTGVSEGVIGSDRIISLLTVADNNLAIEEKGIYSVEKFLIARHLMYWQVYLHKTVLSAEYHLLLILKRLIYLKMKEQEPWMPPNLKKLMEATSKLEKLYSFVKLDDTDIGYAIKTWTTHDDIILKELCMNLINRKLLKVKFFQEPISQDIIRYLSQRINEIWNSDETSEFFLMHGQVTNIFYHPEKNPIYILSKKGTINKADKASKTISSLSQHVEIQKFYLLMPDFLVDEVN